MVDLVVTYLDNEDPEWIKEYNKYKIFNNGRSANGCRWRNWDTFKYFLRCIAENMPFVNNLFVVVASESQVPEYINKKTVKIVRHSEFIPDEFLPTFNSNAIEMFFANITELSEKFIYSNDDMFAINRLTEQEFFNNDNPLVYIRVSNKTPYNLYTRTLSKTESFVNKIYPTFVPPNNEHILRSDHSMNPMLKSMWRWYWDNHYEEIKNTITRFRSESNITQELSNYNFYMKYMTERTYNIYNSNRRTKYFSYKPSQTSDMLKDIIMSRNTQLLCINDNKKVHDFEIIKKVTCEIFEKRFPNKCKYEI